MIIGTNHPAYQFMRAKQGAGRWNGAYFYALEIERNIVPRVRTDRNWVLLNVESYAFDHSVVFVHNNRDPHLYDWLRDYRDLVLVCGVPDTVPKVAHLGRAVYLPLSIDVAEVMRHKAEKTKDVCFAGRPGKAMRAKWANGDKPDVLCGIPRDELLTRVARYRRCYAVGRCAIEARALGCEIVPYDPRYPDPSLWQVVDNAEAAEMLQRILDGLDG